MGYYKGYCNFNHEILPYAINALLKMQTITIKKPDDWHLHLRDGKMLAQVVQHSARQFGRALIMPNLQPPVVTVADALSYQLRIQKALPDNTDFIPKMALYLTENTKIEDVKRASQTPEILAFKLYPAGATTNSQDGVNSVSSIMPILEEIANNNIVLCVHGEATDPSIDVFDREKIFIDQTLSLIVKEIPSLRIVLEHISTKEGVDFVKANNNVAATITAHHLLENRNAMFKGGLNPHNYCLPVLKRSEHQQHLIKAAISGSNKFFAGSDSAPHLKSLKESSCGCAGIYTAFAAVELYAQVFSKHNSLEKMENFMSVFGADFYGLPHNQNTITLINKPWQVPKSFFSDQLVPYLAGGTIKWQMQ